MRSKTSARRRGPELERCAECGCAVEPAEAIVQAGRAYCHVCGYDRVEQVKGSASRRPL